MIQELAGLSLAAVLPKDARAVAAGPVSEAGLPDGASATAEWLQLPGKRPLIKRTFRPPNLETPLAYLRTVITPNEAFFVRYHHARLPEPSPADWRLAVSGPAADRAVSFSLADLRELPQHDLVALCLCSGNRRGLFAPHVTGVQWGSGAMGNARWRGVRLRDVLTLAGVHADAVEVAFAGDDEPVVPESPDYRKSLPIAKAMHADTLIALEMNGEKLPALHGAPARLVVPGWTATYWVKHLSAIELRTTPFDGFWVKSGYRLPAGKFPGLEQFPTQETPANTPITEIIVNSLITEPAPRQRVSARGGLRLRGFAWDGGAGVERVEVSTDAGASWQLAELGADLGRYSLRSWSFKVERLAPGTRSFWVRASNRKGMTQPIEAVPNPSGYHHNAVQKIDVVFA